MSWLRTEQTNSIAKTTKRLCAMSNRCVERIIEGPQHAQDLVYMSSGLWLANNDTRLFPTAPISGGHRSAWECKLS